MRFVEIKEHNPAMGAEYTGTGYPGPGIYFVPRLNSHAIVGSAISAVFFVTAGSFPPIEERREPELKYGPWQLAEPPVPTVTESFALRALAMALNPQTALFEKAFS